MKKLFYILTFATSSLLFGQIELAGSIDEKVSTYSSNSETFYVSSGYNINKIRIFDENFNLYKEFSIDLPEGTVRIVDTDNFEKPSAYILSKGIFDLDDKLDIIVLLERETISGTAVTYGQIIRIYNEDGEIVKQFNEYDFIDNIQINVFHDYKQNINKLTISGDGKQQDNSERSFTDIYTLPSKTLSLNENNTVSSSLKIYPNPVTSVLTIDNPNNGVSEAKVFDMNGRLVKTSSFSANDKSVNVNVSDLSKGNYVIKIGNSVSKIIKK